MKNTATKRELVQKVAKKQKMQPKQVKEVVQCFLDEMIDSLSEGGRLEFRHFGVFQIIRRKAKIGRNPKRPEVPIQIGPCNVVKFTPGKKMSEEIMKFDTK